MQYQQIKPKNKVKAVPKLKRLKQDRCFFLYNTAEDELEFKQVLNLQENTQDKFEFSVYNSDFSSY